ncbi:Uncharacterised protein [Mycobacterium tuberculosis]|nr:Uncharacterised protein [Mycobacterium tuberculosis]
MAGTVFRSLRPAVAAITVTGNSANAFNTSCNRFLPPDVPRVAYTIGRSVGSESHHVGGFPAGDHRTGPRYSWLAGKS